MMTSVSMFARQVVVGLRQQLVAQFGEVGELAVEGEGEPLPFAAVMPLERLGVAPVVGPAGGVADVADGGPAGELLHDAFVLGLVVEAERLDDGADLLVGVEEFFAARIVGGEAGRQLAAVLQVEQHSRHQPRHLLGTGQGGQPRRLAPRQMINRGDAALVVQLVHAATSRRARIVDRSSVWLSTFMYPYYRNRTAFSQELRPRFIFCPPFAHPLPAGSAQFLSVPPGRSGAGRYEV